MKQIELYISGHKRPAYMIRQRPPRGHWRHAGTFIRSDGRVIFLKGEHVSYQELERIRGGWGRVLDAAEARLR